MMQCPDCKQLRHEGECEIYIIHIEPREYDWLPPDARTLEDAYLMGSRPPRLISRKEFEKLYPKKEAS